MNYYERNKEKKIKYAKEYYLKNKEKCKQLQKEWIIKNKYKIKEYYIKKKEIIKQNYIKNKEKSKNRYLLNKKKILKQAKEYRLKNKEKCKQLQKEWRMANKDKCREYYIKNKEKISNYRKSENYVKKRRERHRIRNRERYLNDPQYRLNRILSKRFQKVLKKAKIVKSEKTLKLLGCSLDDFKKHIESQFQDGMTWENHGLYGWHIDHIIPCAAFDLTDVEQRKKCFHYTNLRPLWAKENLLKGANVITPENFPIPHIL